jgi:hypothetical protein
MDQQVLVKGYNELEISNTAMSAAASSAAQVKVSQQELVAKSAMQGAIESNKKVLPLLPEARSQALEVRKYAFLASAHRNHAAEVLGGFRHIEGLAVDEARKAVLGWISGDASKTAEDSVVDNRGDRLANAVAAAAEPYHLAVLRNQKFCKETYAKAKDSSTSSQKLKTDAQDLALAAQDMQTKGLLEAQTTMTMAHEMASKAEEMRVWANKLYKQASDACTNVGSWQLSEQQAADNAAATHIMNAPMKLPPA